MTHLSRVRSSFALQASEFSDSRHTIGSQEILAWIVEHVRPEPEQLALDVASGTALLASALAPRVGKVVALDATLEMLREGRRAGHGAGLQNVAFLQALAQSLPFSQGTFDVVASRLALHHVPDPARMLFEMCRVAKPGGGVFLIDLVSPEDPVLGKRYNDLERLRDPSHVRALPIDELMHAFLDLGRAPTLLDLRTITVDFGRWVELTQTPPAVVRQIRETLLAEVNGGEVTGFQPSLVDGVLKFHQRWAIVRA